MKFGDNLKKLRKLRKLSQEELAFKVGVSRQSVSKWETGEAYPEMNNILELCKIFRCNINDLIHEDMSDIDSLDEEIKMNVVKFKKDKQKKMKGISKAIYILSRIGKIISIIGIIIVAIVMLLIPFTINNIDFKNNKIMLNDNIIGTINNEEVNKVEEFFNNHSTIEIIIYDEIISVCLIVSLAILKLILNALERLFVNIHNGDTPFTIENIDYIKKIAKLLIIMIIFPTITGFIMELIINVDLEVEFELSDLIFVLIIISISYIFEYGYQIQLDSKGIMYGEEDER